MTRISTSDKGWEQAVERCMRAGERFTVVTSDEALAKSLSGASRFSDIQAGEVSARLADIWKRFADLPDETKLALMLVLALLGSL